MTDHYALRPGQADLIVAGGRRRRRATAVRAAVSAGACLVVAVLAAAPTGAPRADRVDLTRPTPAPTHGVVEDAAAPAAPLSEDTGAAVLPARGAAAPGPATPPAAIRGRSPMTRSASDATCDVVPPEPGDGLCTDFTARPKADGGYDVTYTVCRHLAAAVMDQDLRFRGRQEVDLVLRRGDDVLWSWGRGQGIAPGGAHRLAIPAGDCFAWSHAWEPVDQWGTPLERGTYELSAAAMVHNVMPEAPVAVIVLG